MSFRKTKAVLRHFTTVCKHKYYVWQIGRMLGVPAGQLLVHDLSKFSWIEIKGYCGKFYDAGDDWKACWEEAWRHHSTINLHHPEAWRYYDSHYDRYLCAMWDVYLAEMVADWFAAAKAYEGKFPSNFEDYKWYQKNFKTAMARWGFGSMFERRIQDLMAKVFNKLQEQRRG